MSRKPHRLEGQTFGPLRVLVKIENQNGNSQWAYFCLACGHIGKRLGVRLLKPESGYVACPKCRELGPVKRSDRLEVPSIRDALDWLGSTSFADTLQAQGYRAAAGRLSRNLTELISYAHENDIVLLRDRIDEELARRGA